jgi:hypothetical protein
LAFSIASRPKAARDREVLRVGDHVVELLLREAARRRDRDRLLLAGLLVLRVHADDAVGVDLEGDLDLHLSRGARRRPVRMNSPSSSFSSARLDSPCMTRIFTAVWLSRTVVKIFARGRDRRVLRDQLLEVAAERP